MQQNEVQGFRQAMLLKMNIMRNFFWIFLGYYSYELLYNGVIAAFMMPEAQKNPFNGIL